MSLSRAELEAMDRDELIEAVVELSQTVEDLRAAREPARRARESIRDDLADHDDRLDAFEEQVTTLQDAVVDVEAMAQGAYHAVSGGSDRSKTDIARDITRNLLVVKIANDCPPADRPVTVTDIQERAEPKHDLAWTIVDRAWSKLQEEWPQFHETTKNGQQALSLRPDKVTPALAKVVETDLERTDLTKRFVGGNGEGGSR